jgi:hypothetical protein
VHAVLHTKQRNIKHIMAGKKACRPTKHHQRQTKGSFLLRIRRTIKQPQQLQKTA